jgi:hypothetical protein
LTPGASGSNEASLTYRFVEPWTRPKLSVAHRRVSSPIGAVEQRWTVITLALLAENVEVIVARSRRDRTTGAPLKDG